MQDPNQPLDGMETDGSGCRWDPVQPESCFDENSCGCYMDPCEYFGVAEEDCSSEDEEVCCSLIETC